MVNVSKLCVLLGNITFLQESFVWEYLKDAFKTQLTYHHRELFSSSLFRCTFLTSQVLLFNILYFFYVLRPPLRGLIDGMESMCSCV